MVLVPTLTPMMMTTTTPWFAAVWASQTSGPPAGEAPAAWQEAHARKAVGKPPAPPRTGWDAQRPEREAARQSLTPEAREAFRVADLSSGIDPALAAATPVKQRRAAAAQASAVAKAPEVAAGR